MRRHPSCGGIRHAEASVMRRHRTPRLLHMRQHLRRGRACGLSERVEHLKTKKGNATAYIGYEDTYIQ
jgi:hypothetical protein